MEQKREKYYVEYPLCLSYQMAVAWLESGNELWQEDSNEFPACGGFDDVDVLEENFPEKELDFTDNIHLVPSTPEMTSDRGINMDNCVTYGEENKEKLLEEVSMKHLEKYKVDV